MPKMDGIQSTKQIKAAQPAIMVTLGGILDKIAPKFAATPPVPSSTLSRDEAVTRAYDTDPLVEHGNVRARMGYQIVINSYGKEYNLCSVAIK